jgi:energy-coupling factor transport system permease protein
MLLASLNIVPEMQRQLKIVRDAQEARGLIVHKSLLSKVTAFIPLIGPVILSSLVNSQQRGMSLELKGLSNLNVERTSLIVNQDKAQDKVIRGALWIFLGIIIIVSVKMRLK